ncbi:MAG TPA: CBS domain-containing protein [Actinomycetota bacterium]|nr:CBS domain-containing protein [Actinomycetota bacterium]
MKVSELYRPQVVTARGGEDLTVAASRMAFHEIGSLAVFDRERLVGIITESDVARAVAAGRDCSRATVRELMTPQPVTVGLGWDAARAAWLMLVVGARHLPVVEAGRVMGMVSARDLLAMEAWDFLKAGIATGTGR